MSIRENDVTVSAENNTDNAANGKVHQAPLAHEGKKPELSGFLNKIKRAFSTEDTYTEKDSPQSDKGYLTEDNNGINIKNIFDRFKHDKKEAVKEQPDNAAVKKVAEQKNDTPVQKTAETSSSTVEKKPETKEKIAEKAEEKTPLQSDEIKAEGVSEKSEPLSEDDELELAMINAILDGKDVSDMKFPEPEELSDDNIAEKEQTESILGPELDIQNAFEDEEADFVMADFEADGEETEDITITAADIDNSEVEELDDGTHTAEIADNTSNDTESTEVTAAVNDGTQATEVTDNTIAEEIIVSDTSIVIIDDNETEEDDFDEEVQVEDEPVFDESLDDLDDIDIDELADLDLTIDISVSDSKNITPVETPKPVVPVIDITPENTENTEKTENNEKTDTPQTDEKQTNPEPVTTEEKTDIQTVKAQTSSSDTKTGTAVSDKKSSFFSKTKDKLVEMWNTKSEPVSQDNSETHKPDISKISVPKFAAAVLSKTEKNEPQTTNVQPAEEVVAINEEAQTQSEEKTDISNVPVENKDPFPDAEPTPILRDDEDEEDLEEVTGEELYKDLFNTESELDKFKIKLYGENYKEETKAEKKPSRPKMTVITNDSLIESDIDREKVRSSLNVVERDPKDVILTEKQRKQEENNRMVLEKCEIYDQETAQRRAEARKERHERTAREYEKRFENIKHVTELNAEDYVIPDSIEFIKVKSGNFIESVKHEYDFYIGYLQLKEGVRKQINKDVPKTEEQEQPPVQTADKPETPPQPEKRVPKPTAPKSTYAKRNDKLGSVIDALDELDRKNPDSFEYRSDDDASSVRRRLRTELARYKSRFTMSMLLTIALTILCLFSSKFSVGAGENAAGGAVRVFAVLNFIIYAAEFYNVRSIIKHGFRRITKLETNRDTIIAAASTAAALQAFLAIFTPGSFLKGGMNLYTIIIMFLLTVNTYGRYKNTQRISMNFRFVADSDQKYTAKFFSDQRMLATLLSGTRNERSELVFQKKTAFLKHFIRLSREHDPGEEFATRLAVPTFCITALVTIIYAVLSKNFCDTVSFLTIMLCTFVPVCSQTLGSLPLCRLAKTALDNNSMVVGYPAIKEFADSAALMIDAKELYPEGAVHMETLKTFDDRRKDEAVLAAAAVMIAAGGAMAGMYDELIKDNKKVLPSADNVMYLDGKGLIGWVNGERYFIGTRELLISQGIEPMPVSYEKQQKKDGGEILYIARSGQLVAMYIVTYSANGRVADVLSSMESTGVNLLIRTTDPNITAERIAKDFGISYQNIKILEQKNSNVIRDEMIGKERSYPAFIATKGGVTSFGKALTECIQTKENISMSIAIQIVAVILAVLVVVLFGLFAGVVHIHAVHCFICTVFWTAAILAGPAMLHRFQHSSRL